MSILSLFEESRQVFLDFKKNGELEKYPSELKRDAIRLMEYYPVATLAKHLSVHQALLMKWQGESLQPAPIQPSDWVSVNFEESPCHKLYQDKHDQPIKNLVTLHLPHGMSIDFDLQSSQAISSLICSLIKGLGA